MGDVVTDIDSGSPEYQARAMDLFQEAAEVALKVRYTKALIAKADPIKARVFAEKCESIIHNTFVPGCSWEQCTDALDTVYGLCLMAQSSTGPVQ